MTGPNGAARMGNVLIMHRSHLETAGPPPAQETAGDGRPAGGVRGKPAFLGPSPTVPLGPGPDNRLGPESLGSDCLGGRAASSRAASRRPQALRLRGRAAPKKSHATKLPLLERDGGRLQGISSRAPPSGRPRKAESDSNAVPTLTLAKLHVRGLTSLN